MAKDAIDKSNTNNDIEPVVMPADLTTSEQTTIPEPMIEILPEESQPSERRQIVKSAGFVMLGNLGSSVLGMVRQIVVTGIGTQVAGPFNSALLPAQTFNDFLVNGSVPGALIPTFTDYAAPEKRDELRRLVFTLVNLIGIIMLIAALCFVFFISPWFIKDFLVSGYKAAGQALTLQYSQIIFFSLVALGPFAVLLAALYSLKEFGWPAFATASYHVGIIIGAVVGSILGERYYGHLGLAFGVLLGAVGEIALLIPGLRRQRFDYMFVLDLKHPAIRRILRLYAPVALSFLVSTALIFFDQHLASNTPCLAFAHVNDCGAANYTALRAATTLIQFPIGLVAAALSFAVLPTLSQHVREHNDERFKETLLLGFRLGLLLMIPAAAGLIVLQTPIVDLVFRHHNYTPADAHLTAIALQNYAYQLPFVAMDQLLIAAFYARKNTIIPVVVLFVSMLGYLAVALPFRNTVMGMPMLALANTVQNSMHGIILLFLLRFVIGSIRIRETIPTVLKILIVTAAMVGVAWGAQVLLSHVHLFSLDTLLGSFLTVIVAGGLAVVVFVGGVLLLKVEEIGLLKGAVLAKLGRK